MFKRAVYAQTKWKFNKNVTSITQTYRAIHATKPKDQSILVHTPVDSTNSCSEQQFQSYIKQLNLPENAKIGNKNETKNETFVTYQIECCSDI
jgi:hypothetical protein